MRRRTVIISLLALVAVAGAVAGALLASSGGSGNGGGSSPPGHLLVGAQHPAGGHRHRAAHSGQHYDVSSGLSAPQMCGLRTTPGTYRHVLVLFEENHSYGSIYGSSSAPFINSVASKCGLATNYHNITHPSLPEYMAATTGASLADLNPFLSDCTPGASCQWTQDNIFNQVDAKGLEWRSYAQTMPSPCGTANSGYYAPRHNPAVYDTDLSDCATNDLPLGTPSASPLLNDLSTSQTAPAFAWITPNLCDDMHGAGGCPSNVVLAADSWLKLWLPKIISSAVYQQGHTALLIAWDEGEPGTGGEDCSANSSDQSCHVMAIVVAPSVKPGARVSRQFNHYSLLKTAEDLLGLPELGQAATAASMVAPFNL